MRALALGALALVVGACDTDFDPVQASDKAFSMHGVLDASADTQWVRVEPVARTTDPLPGPLDAEVALVLPDGTRVPMTQEVRTFGTGPAHLFRTTHDIQPGRTYRVSARRPDGAETTATVSVPTLEGVTVEVDEGPAICPVRVTVFGAEAVADVRARYRVRDGGAVREEAFTHVDTAEPVGGGGQRFFVYPGDDVNQVGLLRPTDPAELLGAWLTVAVGTADWPTQLVGMSLEARIRYSSPTVEGGLGFVGGVVTQTVPFAWDLSAVNPDVSPFPCGRPGGRS